MTKNIFATAVLALTLVGSSVALNCKRTVKSVAGKEIKVEITIDKDQMTGFARLAEIIPAGAEIKYAKSEGGSFTVQDNRLKFIWMALPNQKQITVSYTMNTASLKQGSYDISGKFSYVEGEQTKEFELNTTLFSINTSNLLVMNDAVVKENPAANSAMAVAVTKTSIVPAAIPAVTTSATAKVSKVVYGLQIASTKDMLPANYFSKKHNVKELVKVETINGVNKYVVGEFKSTADAVAYRETLVKNGVTGAFVVPYANNKRITLEEAKQLETK
jgi:hypothetical protein